MIKCEVTPENLRELIDDGYSFRFNSFVEPGDVHVLSPEQLEEINIDGADKIATVSYEHRYLAYFIEYGLGEGFEKCKEYALKKLSGDEWHSW